MKVRVLVDVHDVTAGAVYDVIKTPNEYAILENHPWVMDDVGDAYILFPEEYEVVTND